MRVLIWARAQVAVPLAVALECPLLIGGISEVEAELMIERFKADPNGIMIATAAFQTGWRADVEAVTLFTEESFVMDREQCASRVRAPSIDCPTVDDFMTWYNERNMKKAKESSAEKPLKLQCVGSPTGRLTYRSLNYRSEPEMQRLPRLRDARREPGGDFDVCAKHDPRPVLSCPMPRQEQDELVCTKCRIRWDAKEDKPDCKRADY